MKKGVLATWVVSMLFFTFASSPVRAEVVDQTVTLNPGWNAVFLEVEPVSTEPADVFSSSTFDPETAINDLESVWRWNPRTSTVEFVQDPGTLMPDQPQWMAYYPGQPIITNLYAINGETAYLIHMGGSATVTWTVSGEPLVPGIDWKPNSFNFVGFHFFPGSEPFFDHFFSTSLAHAGQDIYILNTSGTWEKVLDPASTKMKSGEGFWVYCKGSSEFTGPLSVQLDQGAGLYYGTKLVEQDLRIYNHSATDQSIHLTVASVSPLYLHYWLFDPDNNIAEWVLVPHASNLDIPIKAGDMQKIRLGVRRAGLTPGLIYEDNLYLINDDASNWIRIPVAVTGISYSGLWVGNATITKVSQPTVPDDEETPTVNETLVPQPTGSEFSFRLITHVDDQGQARLLKEVIQLWQEGTWKPDPNNLGNLIPDEPGHFVLIANDGMLHQYSGAALRDGQPVGRRISSPAFGFTGPQAMTGSFQLGSDLTVTLFLPADDPTNPFRHKFHPDHKVASQSYEITRQITLVFRDEDDQGRPITGVPVLSWGSSEIGGIYKESILGLNKEQINIEGTFVLKKSSSVDQLVF